MQRLKRITAPQFFFFLRDLTSSFLTLDDSIKRRFIFSFFLVIITISLNIVSPLLLKQLVGNFSLSLKENRSILFILGFSYGFSWGMSQIIMQLREIISFKIVERIIRILTLKIFDKANSFSVKYFVHHQLGDVLSTINTAQEGVPYLFSGVFLYLIPTIIEIIIACTIMATLLPLKFTAIFLIMLVTYVAFSMWGINKSTAHQEKSIDKNHEAYSYLVDRLINYETIKIFCKQQFESEQLDLHLRESEEAQVKASIFIESVRLGQGAILGISLLFLILAGVWAVIDHEIRLEGFILVNAYFMQLCAPLNYFSLIVKDIKKGFMNIGKAYDILNKKSESYKKSGKLVSKLNLRKIELKNVTFGYQEERPTLEDLSFCLEKGKVTSLVGKTGSGKSTIAKLLLRFYDPFFGTILVDGNNYEDHHMDTIRQNIGYVPQDPVLFCNTIYYNLTYGNPNASVQEIKVALEKADLNHFVANLPNGLDTFIGERGVSLSGGEKQRLALARIFLTKKKLYIFDEATSALDSKTQKLIQNHILSLKKDAAVLIISHRLASVVDSDEILVLSEGQIIERGNHSFLLSLNKNYASLWKGSIAKSL